MKTFIFTLFLLIVPYISPAYAQSSQVTFGGARPTQGAPGATGATGPTGPPASFKGTWSSTTTYAAGDAVAYSGSSYVSLQGSNSNNVPTGLAPWWAVLAQQGGLAVADVAAEVFPQINTARGVWNLIDKTQTWNGTSPATPLNTQVVSGRLGSTGTLNTSGGYGPYAYAVSAFPGQGVTGFIPVAGYSQITSNTSTDAGYLCFYDNTYTAITSSCLQAGGTPFTVAVPSGAFFYRQTFNNGSASPLQNLMIVPGASVPGTYQGFGQVDSVTMNNAINSSVTGPVATNIAAAQQNNLAQVHATLNSVINLFDKSNDTPTACVLTASGATGYVSDHTATNYIPVFGLGTVVANVASNDLNSNYGYAFYDANKNFLTGTGNNAGNAVPVSVPAGAYFYRQCFNSGSVSTAMVVAGSTLPGTYIAFGQVDSATLSNTVTSMSNSARTGQNYLPTLACTPTANTATACTVNPGSGAPVHIGVWGDSITAIFGQAWQQVVLSRTGGTIVYQDARAGRSFDNSLECYGITGMASWTTYSSSNYTPGNYDATTLPSYCGTGGTNIGYQAGQSLATNLANVDVMLVVLGTNSVNHAGNNTIGALGDAPTAGTLYGDMGGLINALQTAKPGMKIMIVTVQLNTQGTAAQDQATANAEVTFGASMGIPVLNMFANGGVNSINLNTMTRDGIHPSVLGFARVYGPAIAQFMLNNM